MAAQETAKITLEVETKNLKAKLKEASGVSEEEFKRISKALDKSLRDQEKAAARTAKKNQRSWRQVKKSLTAVTGAVTVLTAAVVSMGSALAAATKDVIDYRNELSDAAARTGLAAETLQALKQAAEGSGQEFNAVATAAQRIPKLLADVEAGLTTATRAFDNLGVATHNADGTMRDADDVLTDVVGALGSIEDETTRAARAMDLFGRSGGKFIQAVGGGAEQMEALVNFTNKWGVSTAPEALEAADRMQKEIAAVGTVWRGAKDRLLDYIVTSSSLEIVATTIVGYSTTAIKFVDLLGERLSVLLSTFKAMASADSPLEAARLGLDAYTQAIGFAGGGALDLASAMVTGRERAQELRKGWSELMDSLGTRGDGGVDGGGLPGAADGAEEAAKALEQVAKITKQAGSDLLTPIDKVNESLREQANILGGLIIDYGLESKVGQAANDALTAITERAARDRQRIQDEASAARILAAQEEAQRLLDIEMALNESKMTLASSIASAVVDIAGWATDEQGRITMKGWAVRSAAAIVEAGLNVASAISNASTVPPPATPFAMAAAAVQSGAALAGVVAAASKSIPQAYTGIDIPYAASTGTPIIAHPGESVIDRTSTEQLRHMGETYVQTWIGGRQVADTVAEQVHRGGPLTAQISRRAGRLGHTSQYRSV